MNSIQLQYILRFNRKEQMQKRIQKAKNYFSIATLIEKEAISKEKIFEEYIVRCNIVSNSRTKLKLTSSFLILTQNEASHDSYLVYSFNNINFRFKIRYPQQASQSVQSLTFQLKHNDQVFCQIQGVSSEEQEHIISTFIKRLPQQGAHEQYSEKQVYKKGNLSSLYLVKKKHDQKPRIIKASPKKFLMSNDYRRNGDKLILNELSILRQLQHENIVRLEGVSASNNTIYVIFEYIGAKNLLDFLESNNFSKATTQEIASCLSGILDGLKYLSKRKIAHRDIKPANIVFRNQKLNSPVIIDFELVINCEMQNYITTRCGTPGYIAPEILNNTTNAPINPVCDIFSAGIIFYNLLTRKAFFRGSQPTKVTRLNADYTNQVLLQKLSDLKLNPITEDLLIKMLEENPDKRITAQKALQHPFFVELNPENHDTMDSMKIPFI